MQKEQSNHWLCKTCEKTNVQLVSLCMRCSARRPSTQETLSPGISAVATIEGAVHLPVRGATFAQTRTVQQTGFVSQRGNSAVDGTRTTTTNAWGTPETEDVHAGQHGRQAELASINKQLALATEELTKRQQQIAHLDVALDKALLSIEQSKQAARKFDVDLVRRKLNKMQQKLTSLRSSNDALERECEHKHKSFLTLTGAHESNVATINDLTRDYSHRVPALSVVNSNEKQGWSDMAVSLYDVQQVLTSAIYSVQNPLANELEIMKQKLAQRRRDIEIANEDFTILQKERVTAHTMLEKEKQKCENARNEVMEAELHATHLQVSHEDQTRKLEALRTSYTEDVSALRTRNTQLQQQWCDIATSLFDTQSLPHTPPTRH